MNTTPGTNTNPTANALALILRHVSELVAAASFQSGDEAMPSDEVDALHSLILGAIAQIARSNGNSLSDIDAIASVTRSFLSPTEQTD
jgi:hypothetical protein